MTDEQFREQAIDRLSDLKTGLYLAVFFGSMTCGMTCAQKDCRCPVPPTATAPATIPRIGDQQ